MQEKYRDAEETKALTIWVDDDEELINDKARRLMATSDLRFLFYCRYL
jgi:hypothetical protein